MSTQTTTTDATAEPQGVQMLDRTMCLRVYLGRPGTRRQVESGRMQMKDTSEEEQPDEEMLHVSKDILESSALKMVGKHDGLIKTFVKSRSLPSLFRGGIYLLPVALVETVDEKLETMRQERLGLIDTFMLAYPAAVEEARTKLGPLFSDADYPNERAMRAMFKFETQYLTFSTPGKLKSINKALFERERAKAAAKWSEAADEITNLLRLQMKELVDHMVDRVTPGEDGKPKKFQKSLVTNIADFLGTFPFRNVTDDTELSGIVMKARDLLDGVDVKQLRESDGVRDYVAKGFTDLKASLETMVITPPKRRINLDAEAD